jgi:hypothetical protein
MPAGKYDITIDQGATFELPLTLQVPLSVSDPTLVPMDLTGYTCRAQIRDFYNNPSVLAEFGVNFGSSSSGVVTGSAGSSGSVVLSLTASQTASMPYIRAVWDMKLYIGASEIRILQGDAWIRPAVTRP